MTTAKTEEIETYITFDHTDNPVARYKDDIAIYRDMISKMFIKAVNEMRGFNVENNGAKQKSTVIYLDLVLPTLGIEGFSLDIEESNSNEFWERWIGELTTSDLEELMMLGANFRKFSNP